MICMRCSLEAEAHPKNPHLCEACVKAEDNRVSYYRQHNFNWMDVAKEAEIDVWDRQPLETDREFQIWLAYRDSYPSVVPSYRKVAEQLGTTVNAVHKVGMRWTFSARLQAWAKYCDDLTRVQRVKEIVDMNKKHVDMAVTLQDKLKTAIDNINAYDLSPKEIATLFKLTTDIERKARLDETVVKPLTGDTDNPDLRKLATPAGDLSIITDILIKAGVLEGKDIGVRQTVTTEVVVKE